MKRIVKDVLKLQIPVEPLEFLSDTGIDKTEGDAIIAEMKLVMEKHPEIVSLAAPQIGIKKRICAIKFNDTIKFFINPIITKKSNEKVIVENYLSMPGKEILIARPSEVTAVYYTDEYKYEDNKLLDTAAYLFDQLINTLDGITPDLLGLVSDINEDGRLADCTEEEFSELVEMYKKYVKTKSENMAKEIKEDEELSTTYKKLRFSEDVIAGRTAVVEDTLPTNRAQRRAADKLNKKINKKMKNRR